VIRHRWGSYQPDHVGYTWGSRGRTMDDCTVVVGLGQAESSAMRWVEGGWVIVFGRKLERHVGKLGLRD